MAKRLTNDQRRVIAEKFMEWGNLVLAGLVVTQAISHDGINFPAAIAGILVFAVAYAVTIRYLRGGD